MGKVATSGQEAKAWGFLRDSDSISMNGDRLIQDAKQEVLNLDASGYVQPVERTDILVLGESAQAAMKLALHMMKQGGFISDHDQLIGKKLAKVMSGGDLNHQDVRFRAIPARSRTRGFCLALRRAKNAGADRGDAQNRQAAEELIFKALNAEKKRGRGE